MKRLIFLIIGFLVVLSISGCMGDKIWYGEIKTLHATKNAKNELCFYVDDFGGIDKYYIYSIETTGDVWEFNVATKAEDAGRRVGIDLNKSKLIKLSSIAGEKNCLPYGANLSTDNSYRAKSIDYNKHFSIALYAFKVPYMNEKSDFMFENELYFKYNPKTKRYDIKLQR